MAETSLSIQEASDLSGKSIQTIRRAIKSKRIQCKRKRTAQGFSYMISRESLLGFYKINLLDREKGGIAKPAQQTQIFGEFATVADLKKLQEQIASALNEHKKEKDNFMRLMQAFQDKFVFMENQMKLLESPKKKWYAFWK
jgi:hypothetical protein